MPLSSEHFTNRSNFDGLGRRRAWVAFALLVVLVGSGWSYFRAAAAGTEMSRAAQAFLETLDADGQKQAVMDYESPERVGWHFIPKDERKGLQIKNMNEDQRKAAHALLKASLSESGYDKATQIMELEHVLFELEKERNGGPIRDTERYYFTVFGEPKETGKWGLSMEGHHLSLNFVISDGNVVSSTPSFFAANPATVMNEVNGGPKKGTRVLAQEEQIAFDLVNSLSDDQKKVAVIAEKAPREIRGAGAPQPPAEAPEGIAYSDLDDEQKNSLKTLVTSYIASMPEEVRRQRIDGILAGGPQNVHFAWAGSLKPGVGHYYRVQGPSFLIEFVNTQPDPAGNPANHIHCVWRDMRGDFAIGVKDE